MSENGAGRLVSLAFLCLAALTVHRGEYGMATLAFGGFLAGLSYWRCD